MKVLVTGAAGCLGAQLVRQLLDRGHLVRAVVRPSTGALPAEWRNRAEIARADLESSPSLKDLFEGIDVLVHLAATMRGNAEDIVAKTTLGTGRLLEGMRQAGETRRLVLASSCSVYDCTATHAILDEKSPLETNICDVDGYTIAKVLQERMTRHHAEVNQWALSVLRPAYIYGPGMGSAAVAGIALGPLFLVVGPFSAPRLTHVENCARAFVNAIEQSVEGTFNIIDDDRMSSWHLAGRMKLRSRAFLRIPVPYHAGLLFALLAKCVARLLPEIAGRKLPGIFKPRLYRARFKPLQYDNTLAKQVLHWECLPFAQTNAP